MVSVLGMDVILMSYATVRWSVARVDEGCVLEEVENERRKV